MTETVMDGDKVDVVLGDRVPLGERVLDGLTVIVLENDDDEVTLGLVVGDLVIVADQLRDGVMLTVIEFVGETVDDIDEDIVDDVVILGVPVTEGEMLGLGVTLAEGDTDAYGYSTSDGAPALLDVIPVAQRE